MVEDDVQRLVRAIEKNNRAWFITAFLVFIVAYGLWRINDLTNKCATLANQSEVRRQADISLLKAAEESAENQRKIDKKLDDYLGVHVEQMGPNHRQRYWESLKPYFQGENK